MLAIFIMLKIAFSLLIFLTSFCANGQPSKLSPMAAPIFPAGFLSGSLSKIVKFHPEGGFSFSSPADLLASVPKGVNPFLWSLDSNAPEVFQAALLMELKPSIWIINRVLNLKEIVFLRLLLWHEFSPPAAKLFNDDPNVQRVFQEFGFCCPLLCFSGEASSLHFPHLVRISQNSAGRAAAIFEQMATFPDFVMPILRVAEHFAARGSLESILFDFQNSLKLGRFDFEQRKSAPISGKISVNTLVVLEEKEGRFKEEILATLLHELTHAVMLFVFCNGTNPYANPQCAFEFNRVFKATFSHRLKWSAEERKSFYALDGYHFSERHSELIARFIELFALGMTIERAQEIMPEMLIFWKNRILPALMRFYDDASVS